ncbi:21 kDa protein-like [Coffea eugenioides]|uniref:21 kDa protein n=1 Tax=Coffea arabica TaxID=13443 RepID=A0A6P6W546_COFAR|nr:21 kDa protein-like [Coffea arabica]XP_027158981.1 21 kDa protein-like [Coffea eugenioides]
MEGSSSTHLATILLICLSLTHFSTTATAARALSGATNTEFIRTSCSTTTYPKLCYATLSNHATIIRSDPKLLAHAALSASLDSAKSTSSMMAKLSQSHGMTPRQGGAMRDCVEELRESVDELKNSLDEMPQLRGSNFALTMNDIQTWVSAALTDDDTCMEGFAGKAMNGNNKIAVRDQIVNVAHVTSNALALINSYAALHR